MESTEGMEEVRQPTSEDSTDFCPLCGSALEHCAGMSGEEVYEGVRCEKGCDLWAYYS